MRTRRHLPGCLLATVGLVGCTTTFRGESRPEPEAVAGRAFAALERGEYGGALQGLAEVYSAVPDLPVGRYALLAMAAAEVDPANPARRLPTGLRLLEGFRGLSNNPPWTMPVAGSLQRVGLELLAARERELVAEQARATAELSLKAEAERARRAEREVRRASTEGQRLRRRLRELERQVADGRRELDESRRELARAQHELQRVRRTLEGEPRTPGP